jgi:ketosteroid isomerase-like protein
MLTYAGLALIMALGQGARASAVGDELERFEQRLAATWKAGDCSAWGAMLAPEWSVIHITGAVMTRAEALQACDAPRPPVELLKVDDVSVRAFGDAAVVTGRTSVRTGGVNPESLVLRFTDVFIRRAGRWQVVASHATRIGS